MVAEIIILPRIRVAHGDEVTMIQVTLPRRDFSRLLKRSQEWGMTPEETAASVIEQALTPRKK